MTFDLDPSLSKATLSLILTIFISSRQAELAPVIDAAFSPVMLVATFVAAALGSVFAPFINFAMERIAEINLDEVRFPFPRLRRKDDNYRYEGNLFKKCFMISFC